MNGSSFNENLKAAIENISSMADGNTVLGDTITTPNGTTIIPVSKLSLGYATGGLDYSGKHSDTSKPQNNGGVGGTGVTISPVAFLIISPDGKINLLNVNSPIPNDPINGVIGLIERSPELIEKFKETFSKKKKEETE